MDNITRKLIKIAKSLVAMDVEYEILLEDGYGQNELDRLARKLGLIISENNGPMGDIKYTIEVDNSGDARKLERLLDKLDLEYDTF